MCTITARSTPSHIFPAPVTPFPAQFIPFLSLLHPTMLFLPPGMAYLFLQVAGALVTWARRLWPSHQHLGSSLLSVLLGSAFWHFFSSGHISAVEHMLYCQTKRIGLGCNFSISFCGPSPFQQIHEVKPRVGKYTYLWLQKCTVCVKTTQLICKRKQNKADLATSSMV